MLMLSSPPYLVYTCLTAGGGGGGPTLHPSLLSETVLNKIRCALLDNLSEETIALAPCDEIENVDHFPLFDETSQRALQ